MCTYAHIYQELFSKHHLWTWHWYWKHDWRLSGFWKELFICTYTVIYMYKGDYKIRMNKERTLNAYNIYIYCNSPFISTYKYILLCTVLETCIYIYIYVNPYMKSSFPKRIKNQSKNWSCNANAKFRYHLLEKRSS